MFKVNKEWVSDHSTSVSGGKFSNKQLLIMSVILFLVYITGEPFIHDGFYDRYSWDWLFVQITMVAITIRWALKEGKTIFIPVAICFLFLSFESPGSLFYEITERKLVYNYMASSLVLWTPSCNWISVLPPCVYIFMLVAMWMYISKPRYSELFFNYMPSAFVTIYLVFFARMFHVTYSERLEELDSFMYLIAVILCAIVFELDYFRGHGHRVADDEKVSSKE